MEDLLISWSYPAVTFQAPISLDVPPWCTAASFCPTFWWCCREGQRLSSYRRTAGSRRPWKSPNGNLSAAGCAFPTASCSLCSGKPQQRDCLRLRRSVHNYHIRTEELMYARLWSASGNVQIRTLPQRICLSAWMSSRIIGPLMKTCSFCETKKQHYKHFWDTEYATCLCKLWSSRGSANLHTMTM